MHKSGTTLTKVITAITEEARQHKRGCIIIHGEIGAGKTRFGERLVIALRKRGIKVGGIISPRILDGIRTVGYRVSDISSGDERLLATVNPPGIRVGIFYLSEDSLAFARTVIERAVVTDEVVLLDEVGRLELGGKGHAASLQSLLQSDAIPVIFVRTKFIEDVVWKFGIIDYLAFPIA